MTAGVGVLLIHETASNGRLLSSLFADVVETPSDYSVLINVGGIDYGTATAITGASAETDGRYRLEFDPTVLDPSTFNQGGYDTDNPGTSSGPFANILTLTVRRNAVADPSDQSVLAWSGSNERWEPSTLFVKSVNGQAGVVSLGIQDMDDFELVQIDVGGRYGPDTNFPQGPVFGL